MTQEKIEVGFIGQGRIGKNYANDFEARGYETIRYSLEEPYIQNKDLIKTCDVVFIAVPTPSTPQGFDVSIVENAFSLVGEGKIAIIKSTIVPGTTKELQARNSNCKIFYSPEFLSEVTAKFDVENPFSNIVGVADDTEENRNLANKVIDILPQSPFNLVCTSTEAEFIKYSHNVNGCSQIMLFNVIFDLASKLGADWSVIRTAIGADPMMSDRYTQPVHKSGRGAGGACFIKDLAAFRETYAKVIPEDKAGIDVLESLEKKNIDLLKSTNKDLHLLKGVYGEEVLK
jgi:nucleotide sugar dehydrogenase